MTHRQRTWTHLGIFLAVVGVVALMAPLLDNPALLMSPLTHETFNDIMIAVMLAVSLNLILGMTGQFSLGHGGFVAVGAYAAAVVVGKTEFFVPQLDFWTLRAGLSVNAAFTMISVTGMAAGVMAAALFGLLVGLPTLRLRGDYLAIATLGFGEIVATLIANSEYLERTYGPSVYRLRQRWYAPQLRGDFAGTPHPLAQAVRDFHAGDYYLSAFWIVGGCVLAIWIIRNIKYSTTGRALLAIREDGIASESVGIRTTRYKVNAFVIGAALAGLAGAIFAHYSPLSPNTFRFMYSVTIVLYVILGGQGSITGSALAAVILTLVPVLLQRNTWLDSNLTEKYRMVAYALLIILATLFMRHGIFGRHEITDLARWIWRRIGPGAGPAVPAVITPGVATLLDETAAPDPPDAVGEEALRLPLLRVRNLTMRFGGLKAVDDLSLTLRPGELVGLIGPNGAGKTTVFNALTGVYPPTSGTLEIATGPAPGGRMRSVAGLRPHVISHLGVARTFQNIRLFANLSVLDNVQIAQHAHHRQGIGAAILRTPSFYREEETSRLRALGYLDLFDLAHLADEPANALSYGDQRRLEIARALATRPRLLLLDEPAAGMNPTEKRQLMEMIRSLRTRFGLTILIIEHDMKVIMGVCQRIMVLDYGRTIAQGTPEQIRKNPAVIEAYLGAQSGQV